jgi:hypothetical protein
MKPGRVGLVTARRTWCAITGQGSIFRGKFAMSKKIRSLLGLSARKSKIEMEQQVKPRGISKDEIRALFADDLSAYDKQFRAYFC